MQAGNVLETTRSHSAMSSGVSLRRHVSGHAAKLGGGKRQRRRNVGAGQGMAGGMRDAVGGTGLTSLRRPERAWRSPSPRRLVGLQMRRRRRPGGSREAGGGRWSGAPGSGRDGGPCSPRAGSTRACPLRSFCTARAHSRRRIWFCPCGSAHRRRRPAGQSSAPRPTTWPVRKTTAGTRARRIGAPRGEREEKGARGGRGRGEGVEGGRPDDTQLAPVLGRGRRGKKERGRAVQEGKRDAPAELTRAPRHVVNGRLWWTGGHKEDDERKQWWRRRAARERKTGAGKKRREKWGEGGKGKKSGKSKGRPRQATTAQGTGGSALGCRSLWPTLQGPELRSSDEANSSARGGGDGGPMEKGGGALQLRTVPRPGALCVGRLGRGPAPARGGCPAPGDARDGHSARRETGPRQPPPPIQPVGRRKACRVAQWDAAAVFFFPGHGPWSHAASRDRARQPGPSAPAQEIRAKHGCALSATALPPFPRELRTRARRTRTVCRPRPAARYAPGQTLWLPVGRRRCTVGEGSSSPGCPHAPSLAAGGGGAPRPETRLHPRPTRRTDGRAKGTAASRPPHVLRRGRTASLAQGSPSGPQTPPLSSRPRPARRPKGEVGRGGGDGGGRRAGRPGSPTERAVLLTGAGPRL